MEGLFQKSHFNQLVLLVCLSFLLGFEKPVLLVQAQNEVKPREIIINELMWMGSTTSPYDEWLELKNMTDRPIELAGFKLKGAAESNKEIVLPEGAVISAQGYFLISNNDKEYLFSKGRSVLNVDPDFITSTLSLSNSALKVELYSQEGVLIDQANNGEMPFAGKNSANEKASMERNENPSDGSTKEDWHTASASVNFDPQTTEKGTPKAPNSPPPPPPPTTNPEPPKTVLESSPSAPLVSHLTPNDPQSPTLLSIKKARQSPDETQVLVSGWVTAPPGLFSSRYFYLQDESSGIQVYSQKGDFPVLSLGQKIQVLGLLSTAYQERRIKINRAQDITVLAKESPPKPLSLTIGQIGEAYEGMLVSTKGAVTEPQGSLFYLQSDGQRIKVYLKKEAQIEKPRLKAGTVLLATGIVSQYKEDFRLLPRFNEDLKTEQGALPSENPFKKTAASQNEAKEKPKEEEGKVLGAAAKRDSFPWSLPLALGGFFVIGYLIYDYQNLKLNRNSKVWARVGALVARWRNHRLKRPAR